MAEQHPGNGTKDPSPACSRDVCEFHATVAAQAARADRDTMRVLAALREMEDRLGARVSGAREVVAEMSQIINRICDEQVLIRAGQTAIRADLAQLAERVGQLAEVIGDLAGVR